MNINTIIPNTTSKDAESNPDDSSVSEKDPETEPSSEVSNTVQSTGESTPEELSDVADWFDDDPFIPVDSRVVDESFDEPLAPEEGVEMSSSDGQVDSLVPTKSKVFDEEQRKIIVTRDLLGKKGRDAEQRLLGESPEIVQSLHRQLDKFVQIIEDTDEKDRGSVAHYLNYIVVPLVSFYDEELFNDSVVDTVVEYIRKDKFDYSAAENISLAVEIAGKSNDPNCISTYLDYHRELEMSPDNDLGNHRTKSGLLRHYFACHGIDAKRVRGFKENIFPLIEQDDPEVESLGVGNSYSMWYGRFAISDFITHSLVSEINPKNTRELIHAYREVPTSDFAKFEQNRKDARALQGVLWRGRDWIHDEVPGVHGVLSAMLDYYETKDDESVREEKKFAITKALTIVPDSHRRLIDDRCFDLDNYDKSVKKRAEENELLEETEPAVEVLRRLVENTRQTTFEKPITEDEQLNSLLEQLRVTPNENTGEVYVSWRQVGDLVAYTNEMLLARQGQIGMRPSMVKALAYIDKMATYAMRGISDRDWRELPYDPSFKEIVKFRELTSSADGFKEYSFEAFWDSFTKIPNWPYGVQDAYRKLSNRVLAQVNKLAREYSANPHTSYMVEPLWSGNLNHELMGLSDTRQSLKRYEGLS